MAASIFLVDYIDGQPEITIDDVIYFDEETETYAGGWSTLEDVDELNHQDVSMIINSSIEKLTLLKSDLRFVWVEDVEGWPQE